MNFDASPSFDVDGDIVSYRWDFDDANITSTSNPNIVHTYVTPGTYEVTLTVIDAAGLNSTHSIAVLVKMPTSVSVFTSSSSAYAGFSVNITGELRDLYGSGLENETVVLYFTVSGVSTWTPIASVSTDADGSYSITWIPTATGYFVLKAEWAGNATHFEAANTATLSTLLYQTQYVFSVESNSTISELSFDTNNWKLSFEASGTNGTTGYVAVTVAKSLVSEIENIRVFMDGRENNFTITSIDDSWLLYFTYEHSAHQVEVDLDTTVIPDFSALIMLLTLIIVTSTIVIFGKKSFQ